MSVTHRRPGRHGVLVSNLCPGTMTFGPHADQKQRFGIRDRAVVTAPIVGLRTVEQLESAVRVTAHAT